MREAADDVPAAWEFPTGTPVLPVTHPWHDGDGAVDAFWGPSIHWNTYLERYVMLVNRAKNEHYNSEGIYVAFARDVSDPRAWSTPAEDSERRSVVSAGGRPRGGDRHRQAGGPARPVFHDRALRALTSNSLVEPQLPTRQLPNLGWIGNWELGVDVSYRRAWLAITGANFWMRFACSTSPV